MLANRSMVPATIIPELAYKDVGEAAEWLCKAFGFSKRLLIFNHRAQLSFGNGNIVVTEMPQGEENSGATHRVMVRVEDANSHFERAKRGGAQVINPPTDYPFGERQYTVADLGGHVWTFSQTIDDVDPASWGGTLGQGTS